MGPSVTESTLLVPTKAPIETVTGPLIDVGLACAVTTPEKLPIPHTLLKGTVALSVAALAWATEDAYATMTNWQAFIASISACCTKK